MAIVVALAGCGGSGSKVTGGQSDEFPQILAAGWIQDAGQRIADPEVWNPDLVALDNGSYRIYYEYLAADSSRNIHSAISSDGMTWTIEDGLRVPFASMPGAVTLADGRVRLYVNDGGSVVSLISIDGLTFTREEGTRLSADGADESGGIRHPCAVRLPDDTFALYYDALDSATNIGVVKGATSADGLAWTRVGVVVHPHDVRTLGCPLADQVRTPGAVVAQDGTVYLFVSVGAPTNETNKTGIFLATSANGIAFTAQAGPTISGFALAGESHGAMDAAPAIVGGHLRVYYWVGTTESTSQSAIYSAHHPNLP